MYLGNMTDNEECINTKQYMTGYKEKIGYTVPIVAECSILSVENQGH